MKASLLFFLFPLSAIQPEALKSDCIIANLVFTDDKARLVFGKDITGPVSFIIGTKYGDVPGTWTPDMFSCIGWALDDVAHVLIMKYGDCIQKVIIPAKKSRVKNKAT